MVFYGVYNFHPEGAYRVGAQAKLPEWDDISPDMDLRKWYLV
ncbi:MAG: hypothetical protein UU77_C0009G0013 [candidate division WWE3 bacterium GW2011_GWC1_41_7]|uniref:Uncharacterized protein n=2 Tax=Katanobacteria TaxID=422282 RepID=A0A0G0ZG86_UNCKA|nr:MAG: hypothetical protein UU72_C0043G0003 [candidate division WWE3 bacterium GW2011_GWB1_41_6]KKS21051.1 MAG: hypothetical protein UU77_C0009G0013 [candidate division WWE3 bacterium GW2011_GWC1_41_7]